MSAYNILLIETQFSEEITLCLKTLKITNAYNKSLFGVTRSSETLIILEDKKSAKTSA